MKRIHTNILVPAALVVGILAASVSQAQAGVVVRARIGAPVVKVKVDQRGPRVVLRTPPRHFGHAREISKLDRRMARRLARVTPYNKGLLLEWRRAGYGWFSIGHKLDIPSRVISAARTKLGWQRYLERHERYHTRRDDPRDGRGYSCRKPVLR